MIQFVIRIQRHSNKQPDLTSFWVRGVEWDENELVEMIRHLNFYMAYYDRETPAIVIHDVSAAGLRGGEACRYPFGEFPTAIKSRHIASHLLSLAENARRANPRLAIIFYYQILEYAAFYFMKEETYRRIKQAILRPDSQASVEKVAQEIAETMAESNLTEPQKMDGMLRQIPLGPVWRAIEPNLDRFCEKAVFDGGFELAPVLRKDTAEQEFRLSDSFTKALRDLRNALVHGREQRMAAVIEPTRANDERLRPWLPALSVIALQVVQYLT